MNPAHGGEGCTLDKYGTVSCKHCRTSCRDRAEQTCAGAACRTSYTIHATAILYLALSVMPCLALWAGTSNA
jgi:hypothetical protein